MRLKMVLPLTVVLTVCSLYSARADPPLSSTQPSTTQPVPSGRDTPWGAMNVFYQALRNLDAATLADSYNMPEDRRKAIATSLVSSTRFCRAVAARFGQDALTYICHECRIPLPPAAHTYTSDDWTYPPGQPNVAYGKQKLGGAAASMMQRGPDGIWRMGRIFPARARPRPTTEMAAAMARMAAIRAARTPDMAGRMDEVTAAINAGNYASRDDVINALYPQGSPMAQMRAADNLMKQQADAQEQQLLATKFDPSTLSGAVGAFLQALQKQDPAGMAAFYYADGDSDGKFARAHADQVVLTGRLAEAISSNVDKYGSGLIGSFGLGPGPSEAPEWCSNIQMDGDRATGTFGEGNNKGTLLFRKIGGVWKVHITPRPPRTSAEQAAELTEDNQAITRITADILAGKYSTLSQVRDAMGAAMLNAQPDPMFRMTAFEVKGDAPHAVRPQPGATAISPTNRSSPAGAMNAFDLALENFDAVTLADLLYMPQDKDGSCRRAEALEDIAEMKFVLAAEARFGKDAGARISFECAAYGPAMMQEYTNDQWVITAEYPNLAFSNQITVGDKPAFVPLMHRGADGVWRMGPRFPENSRVIHARAAEEESRTAVLEQATKDIKAGKYSAPDEVITAVGDGRPD
jgi:hypothetical protein